MCVRVTCLTMPHTILPGQVEAGGAPALQLRVAAAQRCAASLQPGRGRAEGGAAVLRSALSTGTRWGLMATVTQGNGASFLVAFR